MINSFKKGGIYINIPTFSQNIPENPNSLKSIRMLVQEFVDSLCTEIKLTCRETNINFKINTLYISGTGLKYLSSNQIKNIYKTLQKEFNLSNLEEFTIEANKPNLSSNTIETFKSIRANRFSINIQTLENTLLKKTAKKYTEKDYLNLFKKAREFKFNNINIDMNINIPSQKIYMWKKDLKKITKLSPEHISIYSFSLKNINESNKMYRYTHNLLHKNKYSQYEICSYSKKNTQCKHNINYLERNPCISFGPAAHSLIGNKRYWNTNNTKLYITNLKNKGLPPRKYEKLKKENIFNEIIINGLKKTTGINLEIIKNKFGQIIHKRIIRKTHKWKDYLSLDNDTVAMNIEGYFILDKITLDLMKAYMKE